MQTKADWIASAVDVLRKNGSWTGRIHVHKLIFVCDVLGLANSPFNFELYQYGPYSREIDSEISIMEAFGGLNKEFPQAGYGPKYCVDFNSGFYSASPLTGNDAIAMEKIAKAFGGAKSSELELIATCLWVENLEHETDDNQIVNRVHEIKPKYDKKTIEEHLHKTRELVRKVS